MEEKKFGERLKKLRKEANITQNDFAEKLLVHSQTVSRWERSIIEPDISQLGEIAATFNITLEKLLDLPESEKTYRVFLIPFHWEKLSVKNEYKKEKARNFLPTIWRIIMFLLIPFRVGNAASPALIFHNLSLFHSISIVPFPNFITV